MADITVEERLDRLEQANAELRKSSRQLRIASIMGLLLTVSAIWIGLSGGWLVPKFIHVQNITAENISAKSFTVLDGYRSVGSLAAVDGGGSLSLHGPGKGYALLGEGKLSVSNDGASRNIEVSALDNAHNKTAFLSVRQGDNYSTFTFDDKSMPILLMRQGEGRVVRLPE
jgi:hypothetical protein